MLVLKILIDRIVNVKLITVFVQLVLFLDGGLHDSCGYRLLAKGNLPRVGICFPESLLLLSEFLVCFRDVVLPKLLEFVGFAPLTIDVDANDSVVLFAQEWS